MSIVKTIVASIAIAALATATGSPDYTLLDQACGVVSRPADCPRLKTVPGLPTGILQAQSSIGCVASNNQCIFSRSIQCRHDSIGQILGEALEALVTCSSKQTFSFCPTECIPAATQLKAIQYVLANVDITKFSSLQSADAYIAGQLQVDQADNVQQILICTADSMAVLKQRRLQDLTTWWVETTPIGMASHIDHCAPMDWTSIQKSYVVAKAKEDAINAAAKTTGPTNVGSGTGDNAAPAVSSAASFGFAATTVAFLLAAAAML